MTTKWLRYSFTIQYHSPISMTQTSYRISVFRHGFPNGQNIWGQRWKACAPTLFRANTITSWRSTRNTRRSPKNTKHMQCGWPTRARKNVWPDPINFIMHMWFDTFVTSDIRCPALPKPLNGRKSENRYWPGTIVRFSCDDGYRLVGYEARRCREDGLWSWGVDPECISKHISYRHFWDKLNDFSLLGDLKYTGRIAGIGVGVILPILIVLVLIIGCFIYQKRSGNQHYTGEPGV